MTTRLPFKVQAGLAGRYRICDGYRYRLGKTGQMAPLGKLRYNPPYLADATAAAQLLLLFTHHPDFLEP